MIFLNNVLFYIYFFCFILNMSYGRLLLSFTMGKIFFLTKKHSFRYLFCYFSCFYSKYVKVQYLSYGERKYSSFLFVWQEMPRYSRRSKNSIHCIEPRNEMLVCMYYWTVIPECAFLILLRGYHHNTILTCYDVCKICIKRMERRVLLEYEECFTIKFAAN